MRNFCYKVLAGIILALGISLSAYGQAYSHYAPYSVFGIGDLSFSGTAYNRTMGGVGIACRNNRVINVMNPASVTARDSLSFMADFSIYGNNTFFKQGDKSSVNNVVSINDCVISFPIWRSSAMMIGIVPYSGTGYNYSFDYSDPEIIGRTGNVAYSASGKGALYQAFVAGGATFWKRLSIGAQFNFYFGDINKTYSGTFSNSSYSGVQNGYFLQLNGFSGKFGVQYEYPIGVRGRLCAGATYSLGTNMRGYVGEFSFSTASAATDTLSYKVDTLANNPGKIRLAGELGVGIAYRHGDRWMVEFDYTRSDWRDTGIDKVPGFMGNTRTTSYSSVFTTSVAESFRLGFEITPNRNDVRYYMRRVTYRGGAYYKTEYYKVDGYKIAAVGLTFGATFPVFRWYNGVTVGFDIGQRGSTTGNLIRERYVNFSVGFNIFDIWFQKHRYE